MKKVYTLMALLCSALMLSAQVSYTVNGPVSGGNPPGAANGNPDVSTTGTIALNASLGANQWSANQTIPFAFDFFGTPVTQFKISANGVLTFDIAAGTVPGANVAIPTTSLPSNSICGFWDEFTASPPTGTNDRAYVETFGTTPNRQLMIRWYSFEWGPSAAFNYQTIILEETTNKVYFTSTFHSSTMNTYATTLGLQRDSGFGVDVGGGALVPPATTSSSTTDNVYWEFTPFTLPNDDAGIASIDAPAFPASPGTQNITATIQNMGANTLSSATIEARVNGAVVGSTPWTGSLVSGATDGPVTVASHNFLDGLNTIQVYTRMPNGVADTDNSNDTAEVTLYFCNSLSGIYTINSGSPTAGTNFNSFADAIFALESCGVSGPTTFNVTGAGPYIEQLTIGEITGASAVNTITFNGNGETLQFGPNSTDRHILKLDGADFFTFNNLNITGTDATYGWGVWLINQANDNSFTNCVIDISAVTSTTSSNSGCIISSASPTSAFTDGNNANNLTVDGCELIGGYQGMQLNGQSGVESNGNTITNNIIRDFYTYGLYLDKHIGLDVSDNDIHRANRVSVGSFYGVYLLNSPAVNVVSGNKIHDSHTSASSLTGLAYCIYFTGCDATVSNENQVINNAIYNINGNGTIYAIYNSSSDHAQYYHNSVSLDHAAATGGTTRGFYQTTTATGIDFRNNIVSVTRGGTGTKHCLYFNTTASTITSDYNVLHMNAPAGTNHTGRYGSDFTSLANWQTANGGAYDQNSWDANPIFADIVNGDLTPNSGDFNNGGTFLGIANDITGATRTATPDPGAWEYTPSTDDAGAISISSPSGPVPGAQNVEIDIQNFGIATLNTVDMYAQITGPSSALLGPIAYSGAAIAPGGTAGPINLGSHTFLAGSYTITAWTANPNSSADANNSNDTTSINVFFCNGLNGAYTINSGMATGGTNYANFTDAINDLITCGISGPVTFDVVSGSGPYNEQLNIPAIFGSSVTNTITFNGNGETLQYAPNSGQRWVWQFSGADYVTVDSLNITSTDVTYGWGVFLTGNSDNVTVNNCNIDVSAVTSTSSSNSSCVVASASSTSVFTNGDNAQAFTLSNSTLTGGYYCVRHNGGTSTKALNCRFENNTLQDFYQSGLYLDDHERSNVEGNDISRANRSTITTFYGIYYTGGTGNNTISKNRIHNTSDQNMASTSSLYGIYFTASDATVGNENQVVNNVIYNFNGSGSIYALYNSSSDYTLYYHNTISLDHTTNTSTNLSRAIYQITTATGIQYMNNNISLTRGGTGNKHGIYLGSTASTIAADYNNYLVSGTNSHVGYYSGNQTTLGDWQAANGGIYAANSLTVDPFFANPAGGDYSPTNGAMNDLGNNLGVADDITGAARSVTPDMGAWEFTPPQDDAGVISLDNPVGVPGSQNIDITVQNFGAVNLTAFDMYVTITGPSTANFGPVAYTGAAIAPSGSSASLTVGTHNFLPGTYTITAWTALPNGNADANNSQDTLTTMLTFCAPLAGNYTINSGVATGGTNFQTFAEAIAEMTTCGVSAPVVFDVVTGTGPYNEQLTIGAISGASSTNTITFNGNGETLSFTPVSSDRHIIKLDGAQFFIFDSLTVVSNSPTYGWGYHLINQAENNTIRNSTIDMSTITSTTSSNSGCIIASASTTSAFTDGDNGGRLTVTGCTLLGGYQSIQHNGASGSKAQNCMFTNNVVQDFYLYGIYLDDHQNATIAGNDISRPVRTSISTFYGVYMTGSDAGNFISKNRIHNAFGGNTGSTSTFYGLYTTASDAGVGDENVFENNAIYNVNHNGSVYGIYNSSSNGAHYRHNTVSLDNTASTSTSLCRGFYQTTTASNVDFGNNLISITRGGSGAKHGIYLNATASTVNADYNVIYVNSAGGGNNVGYYSGNQTTLLDWQAANGGIYGQNSWDNDPNFVDIANDDFTPQQSIFNDGGVNLSVADDLNGTARTATPDPGALEYTPVISNDVGISAIISPVTSGRENTLSALTATETVEVQFTDFGGSSPANVDVYFSVNGTVFGPEQTNISGIGTYTFTLTANLLATGNYTVMAWTGLGGDADNSNDTSMVMVSQIANPAVTLPICADFESSGNYEAQQNTIGIPGNDRIDFTTASPGTGRLRTQAGAGFYNNGTGAATLDVNPSGTPTHVNSLDYVVNLSGYNAATDIILLDFAHAHHGEESHANDRVWVRGSESDPWIQIYDLYANQGGTATYNTVTDIDLSATLTGAGQNFSASTTVRFGQEDNFPATSTTGSDGRSFDDICVRLLPPVDVAVNSIDAPVTGCGLGNETVIITIGNPGTTDQTNIPVMYNLDGGGWTSAGTYTGPMITNGGGTASFSFGPLNFSGAGVHTLEVAVVMVGDGDMTNDTAVTTITNFSTPPAAPTAMNDTTCAPDTNFLLTASSSEGTIFWYDAMVGGNVVYSGETYPFNTTSTATVWAAVDASPCLKISEVDLNTTDYVEIQNLSASAEDYTGWVVAVSNSYADINNVNTTLWNLGNMTAGQVMHQDDNSGSAQYWGSNLFFNPGNHGWVMIIDDQGNVADAVFWEWTEAQIRGFSATINGHAITIGPDVWNGDGFGSSTGAGCTGGVINRQGDKDNNGSADFICQTNSPGTQNPGLNSTFACGAACGGARTAVMAVVDNNCPTNSTVCNAIELQTSEYGFRTAAVTCQTEVGSNVGAQPESGGDPSTICGTLGGVSVWYTFEAPLCNNLSTAEFDITLSTDNPLTDFNTAIRVFESSNDECDGTLTEVACVLDGTPNGCVGGGPVGNSNLDVSATLFPGKKYFVMVDGESGAIGTFEMSLTVRPDAPILAAGTNPQTEIDASWTDVFSNHYDLFYGVQGALGYNIIWDHTSGTNVTLANLQPGTTYDFWVGNSCDGTPNDYYWTPTASLTTASSTCTTPDPLACNTTTANSIAFDWTAVGIATHYHIFYRPVGNAGYSVLWNVSGTSATLNYLNSNTSYEIWVYAVCQGPIAMKSLSLFCTTASTGSKPANDQVDPLYSFTYDGVGYVDYHLSDMPMPEYMGYESTHFEVVDGELKQYDDQGIEIVKPAEDIITSDFEVYPNPMTDDQTTITLDMFLEESQDVQVYLYDMNGKRSLVADLGKMEYHITETIQLGTLRSGVYQIAVHTGDKVSTQKLVVLQ